MINLKGINSMNKNHVQYVDVPTVIRPIPDGQDLPVPEPDGSMEYSSDSEHRDRAAVAGDDAYKPEDDDRPLPLTQAELNDLTRDLNLSKESAQLLRSRRKEKRLLAQGTTFYWYQDRVKELRHFLRFRISHHWFIATALLD